jgi:two-component system, sensor histidine kinase YesM
LNTPVVKFLNRFWWPGIKSIQTQIMLSFIVIVLPVLILVSWVVYTESARSLTQITAQYSGEITDQVTRNIEQYIRDMDDLASLLYWDPDVRSFLNDQGVPPLIATGKRVEEWLATVPKIRSDIRAVYVFGHDGRVLMGSGGKLKPWVRYQDQLWYREAIQVRNRSVVSSSHVQNLFLNQYPWVVSLSRAILDHRSGEILGVILIDLNFSVIDDICNRITLGSRGYVFILDQKGSIVYHPQQQLVYNGLKIENIPRILHMKSGTFVDDETGEPRLVTVCASQATGWRIVGIGYTRDLLTSTDRLRKTVILACLAALTIGLGVLIWLASRIAHPIKRLERSMRRVEAGELGVTVPVTAQYEIAALEDAFNLMSERIRDLLEQTRREQEAKRKSELRALQAQINPHFLYNTLDSVVWMAESGRLHDVGKMVSALAKLFRRALSGGRDIIPLNDEVEHVESYLIIQKVRYGELFDYQIEVAPETNQAQTLKLILQPLVENAIYHGIKHKGSPGRIMIRGYVSGQKLVLEVEDDGVGITPARLANWRRQPPSQKSGVGLTNVEERIQLYFGEVYGLRIESEPDEGTKVTIHLPLNFPKETNQL